MALFKKLKSLVTTNDNDSQAPQENDTPPKNDKALAHLSPITNRIKEWLDDNDWLYHHTPPEKDDDSRTHHIGLGFRDESDFGWNCLIIIQERNQLVSLNGKVDMDEPIDPEYFLPVFVMFSTINQSLSIGNLELSAKTGDLYARIGFDAEFTELSDRMLNSYLQGLSTLAKQAYEVATMVTTLHNPNDNALSILKNIGWGDDETDDGKYFVPTHIAQ